MFDVAGRVVRTLVHGRRADGLQAIVWNGLDDAGRRAGSGIYLYRLTADDYTATRKMVILK